MEIFDLFGFSRKRLIGKLLILITFMFLAVIFANYAKTSRQSRTTFQGGTWLAFSSQLTPMKVAKKMYYNYTMLMKTFQGGTWRTLRSLPALLTKKVNGFHGVFNMTKNPLQGIIVQINNVNTVINAGLGASPAHNYLSGTPTMLKQKKHIIKGGDGGTSLPWSTPTDNGVQKTGILSMFGSFKVAVAR